MVPKKIKILFCIGVSILIVYLILLAYNYSTLPENIVQSIDLKGRIKGNGNKIHLWIASLFNLIVLLFIWYLIKNPQKASYPIEITDDNRTKAYHNMRVFLAVFGIFISTLFAIMVLSSLKLGFGIISIIISSLIVTPLFFASIIKFKL